jgi:hypothetical protein
MTLAMNWSIRRVTSPCTTGRIREYGAADHARQCLAKRDADRHVWTWRSGSGRRLSKYPDSIWTILPSCAARECVLDREIGIPHDRDDVVVPRDDQLFSFSKEYGPFDASFGQESIQALERGARRLEFSSVRHGVLLHESSA